MDYGDKPAAAKWSLFTPPRWSLFTPPLTGEKVQKLLPTNLPAERDRNVRPSTVKLKTALRQIDPDDINLFHGRFLLRGLVTPPPWHIVMPSGGGVHSINIARRSGVKLQSRLTGWLRLCRLCHRRLCPPHRWLAGEPDSPCRLCSRCPGTSGSPMPDSGSLRNPSLVPCLSGCNPHPLYVGCAVIRQARVSEWKLMF